MDRGPGGRQNAEVSRPGHSAHPQVAALKRSQEAATSVPEPVVHRKIGVAADVPPPKKRRKIVEEKALVGAIITDYVGSNNINNGNNNNSNTKNNDTNYKLN